MGHLLMGTSLTDLAYQVEKILQKNVDKTVGMLNSQTTVYRQETPLVQNSNFAPPMQPLSEKHL